MKKDKDQYMDNFTNNLRVLHKDYRALEAQHKDLISREKLEQEIEQKLTEKERLRVECDAVDAQHKAALENYNKQKKLDEELTQELAFLQEQLNESQLNEFKLKMRQQDLKTQLAQLNGQELPEETDFVRTDERTLASQRNASRKQLTKDAPGTVSLKQIGRA